MRSNEALFSQESRLCNKLIMFAIRRHFEVIQVSYTNINYLTFLLIFLSIKKSTDTHILYFLNMIFDLSHIYCDWKNNIFQKRKVQQIYLMKGTIL